MRIGIAFDLVPTNGCIDGPDDRFEEFDKPETISAIADVLRSEGHEVSLLEDGPPLLRRLLDDPPDFVWNLAEGHGISRSREARVPAVLEMLGIPYSGSDPLTLAATLDKDVARRLMPHGVSVPRGVSLPVDVARETLEAALAELFGLEWDDQPVILKPAFEGSSKGIRGQCLADTPAEAIAVFERLAHDYQQPILIEHFIAGDEVTVGLIGNGLTTEILGAMRVLPQKATDRFVYSLEVKRDWQRQVRYESPACLDEAVRERLWEAAMAAYHALACQDVARIDFRVRNKGPFFIEANPLPGLSPGTSDLVILARGHGIEYSDLIKRILNAALVRVGLAQPEPVSP
ncbi:MAG TPA: D-alanine--D-alanine ligase [Isosphaeraceae bacterium]|nr:D-alanine--D-alanine ligase [Isosphaeraceae bacterium]